MALRNILLNEDPGLRKKSRPVKDYNARLHMILDDMRETLIDSEGIGLAAPQVGILRRAVVVLETNVSEDEEPYIIELINPEILETSGEQEGPEGCLSLPGVCGIVKRPDFVRVKAFDRNGNMFEAEGTGLTARAFCHELDHLDGKLYTDIAERMLTDEELAAMYSDEEIEDVDDGDESVEL